MPYNRLIDILIANETRNRQKGRTTALIEMCRKIDGVFVAHSHAQYNVLRMNNMTVRFAYPSDLSLMGITQPIVLDHYLLYLVLLDRFNNSSLQYKATHQLKRELQQIREELMRREIEEGDLKIGGRLET